MAVRNRTFEIAALNAEKPAANADENIVEIGLGPGVFTLWREPSAGQFAMLQLRVSRSTATERMKGLDRFFSRLLLTPEEAVADGRVDGEGVAYADRVGAGEQVLGSEQIWELWEDETISEETLLELMKVAIEEHAAFPTSSPRSSSPSPKSSGRPSTAGSRRQRSTHSS